jgi:hypothetical protein
MLLSVSLYQVATGPEPSNEYFLIYFRQYPTLTELLYDRTLGRFSVEDFDWVILKTFVTDPVTSILGRGFGLGHLTAAPYIPDVWRHYMEGRIIFPKMGVTFFFVNGGLVMLVVSMAYLAQLTPAADRRLRRAGPGVSPIIRKAQTACILMVILLLMRIYVLDVAILVAATSLLLVRQAASGRGHAAPFVPVPNHGPAALQYPPAPGGGRLN